MKRAAVAVIGRHCCDRQSSRTATVLAALPSLSPCSTLVQPSATFSAFSRPRRNTSPSHSRHRPRSRSSAKSAPPPPPPPPPPAAPSRPRPKHAAPYPVTLDQIRAYHDKQSFFSRLTRLRLRLHNTFHLILATQQRTPHTQRVSPAVQKALETTTRVFRTFAPFNPPFPRYLYHHFLALYAATTPATAHNLLTRGRAMGVVGEESVVAVMDGYARMGDGVKVRELMDETRERGERVTVRMCEALLEGVSGDVGKLKEVREEMRQRGVKLSDKCWLLMLPAYRSSAGTTDLRRLLADLSTEQASLTPDLAHAIANSSPDMTTLQSPAGAAALAASVLPQMEYLLYHPTAASPEQIHHLLHSTPSLHNSSRAWSMVLQTYARREHIHTSHIAAYDIAVIHKLLTDMEAASVAEDEWALQVRMLLAAQSGQGDAVLALIKRAAEISKPPPSLFLPVLRTVASLLHPDRLPVLLSLHSYLHTQRLSSHFSWGLVLSLQSELADIAGIRSTLAAMKVACVPLTIHHWHQLLLSSPNTTQTTLLRDMMNKLHVLPSAYTEAIVLSKQPTLRHAEAYYASLLNDAPSPHPVIRLAMADVYGALGFVRWSARQWWKVVSGSAERVTKAEEQSRGAWAVLGEVSEEEMDRMLRRLQAASVGSPNDVRELRRLLQVERDVRREREAEQVQHYRQLLNLDVQLSATAARLEEQRLTSQQQHVQSAALLTQRMRAQQARLEAGLQESVLEMADDTLIRPFGDLMRRIKAAVPYVHMDILEQWENADQQLEAQEEAEAAAGMESQEQRAQMSWLSDAEEMRAKQTREEEEEQPVFVDLDEDTRPKSTKKRQPRTARAADEKRGAPKQQEQKRVEPVTPPPRPVEQNEDWAMMEAARQLVASRRPKSSTSI